MELHEKFDLYGALWLFCSEYHSGSGSRGYRILSRLQRVYSPGAGLQRGEFESEEQEAIYEHLVAKYAGRV